MELCGATIDVDGACVCGMDAGQDLDEGALAGSVCAKKRMDLAAADREVNFSQRHDGSIRFCYSEGRKQWLRLTHIEFDPTAGGSLFARRRAGGDIGAAVVTGVGFNVDVGAPTHLLVGRVD